MEGILFYWYETQSNLESNVKFTLNLKMKWEILKISYASFGPL